MNIQTTTQEISILEEVIDNTTFRNFFKQTMCEAFDKILDEYSRLKYKKDDLLFPLRKLTVEEILDKYPYNAAP